jgi:hypothetical protein
VVLWSVFAANQAQYGLSEQTQVTERFSKAIEALGSDKTDVRIGGIYLLERLHRDSVADRAAILDMLSAYVRDHAPAPPTALIDAPAPDQAGVHCSGDPKVGVAIDIQAAVTVIARRETTPEEHPIDLSHTCLDYANLAGIKLHGADLRGSDLTHAIFDLTYVPPFEPLAGTADFSGANLDNATLAYMHTGNATFRSAAMYAADLSFVELPGADLTDFFLPYSNLRGVSLIDAKLKGANLFGVDLSGANLSGADLDGVKYGSDTHWPEGFTPPPMSGR